MDEKLFLGELIEKGFEKIDENQFVKRLSNNEYYIFDKDCQGLYFYEIVDISDYDEDDLNDYVSGYYRDLEEVKNSYGLWQQVVAEIIAEQSQHYVNL